MNHAVSVQDLTKSFADLVAVDAVTFSIAEGTIFGFLGPNGAGKTTTLKMICGILAPDGGSGQVLGLDLLRESDAIRSRLGYMSQGISLYEDLTAAENLEFYAQIYGVTGSHLAKRREELGRLLSLEGVWSRSISELSGGMRQRAAFACAEVHHPPLLLLDEPTAGVDPLSRLKFWDTLYNLADEGTTILVTTHFMDEAEHCDEIALMDQGRLVATGSPAELRDDLAGRVVEVEAEPWAEALGLAELTHEVSLRGTLLHVILAPGEEPGDLARALSEGGVELRRVEVTGATLEDVFVSRLGAGETPGL